MKGGITLLAASRMELLMLLDRWRIALVWSTFIISSKLVDMSVFTNKVWNPVILRWFQFARTDFLDACQRSGLHPIQRQRQTLIRSRSSRWITRWEYLLDRHVTACHSLPGLGPRWAIVCISWKVTSTLQINLDTKTARAGVNEERQGKESEANSPFVWWDMHRFIFWKMHITKQQIIKFGITAAKWPSNHVLGNEDRSWLLHVKETETENERSGNTPWSKFLGRKMILGEVA